MDGVEGYQRAIQRLSAQGIGLTARQARIYAGQAQAGPHAAALLALPVDTSQIRPIQNSDGGFYWMLGLSALGGDFTL